MNARFFVVDKIVEEASKELKELNRHYVGRPAWKLSIASKLVNFEELEASELDYVLSVLDDLVVESDDNNA